MNILALDTSSHACSLALLYQGEVSVIHELAPMQQAQTILSFIDQLLSSKNITLKQLDALAFGCGPGSFTGVRIAASVIQGLGYAMNLPIIPISSLAALAQAAYMDLHWEKCWVAVDARMSEVYWGIYQVDHNQLVSLVGQESVCKPDKIVIQDTEGWYGVGDGWGVYQPQIVYKPLKIDAERVPMAKAIIQLAIPKFKQGAWVSALDALPVYLRDQVAKKSSSQNM